jgi:tetratricopeptide (TPR) repeat protein
VVDSTQVDDDLANTVEAIASTTFAPVSMGPVAPPPPPARPYVEAAGAVAADPAEDACPWSDGELPALPRVCDVLSATPEKALADQKHTPRLRSASSSLPPTCVEPSRGDPPAHWRLPAWSVVTPAALGLIVFGSLALALCVQWQADDRLTASLVQSLESAPGPNALPFEVPNLPPPRWWRSTARHLAIQAMALHRADTAGLSSDAVAERLDAARLGSPLDPIVRAASTRTHDAAVLSSPSASLTLGLSRDVLTLHQSARGFLAAGRVDRALSAYRRAMELALESDPDDQGMPAYLADHRFALPGENLLTPLVNDLIDWAPEHPETWREALPDSDLARLVAARALHQRGHSSAATILDELAARPDEGLDAIGVAVRAEALALRGRWSDSAAAWRDALTRGHIPTLIARTWWYNAAEVAARDGDPDAAREAWDLARCEDLHDPINLRLVDARARYGRSTATGGKALATRRPGLEPGPDPAVRRVSLDPTSADPASPASDNHPATLPSLDRVPTLGSAMGSVPDRSEDR